ncbi:MAG: hypothetical protein JSU70_15015 [Phycisphaerales bacterium]|nr:MAG: hypothetical protein JSU70_15015 [Phycisphaerales bacterium]
MRSCDKFRPSMLVAFCVYVAISVCLGAVVCADEFTMVPAMVNVLKGVDANDSDIDAIIKECNKILKQANVQLEFSVKNIVRDVNDTGNKDGKIQLAEEIKLDEAGQKELIGKFGAGKGIKICITNKIRDKDATRGLAPHSKQENGQLTAKPIIYIKNLPKVKKESRGNDLAHETCHVLTLGKGHWIDKSRNKKAEGAHNTDDTNNLMYPHNPYRKKDGELGDRGKKLTDDQIKEIQKGAKRLGNTKVAKIRINERGIPVIYEMAPLPTVHGGFVDDMGDVGPAYIDLGAGFLYAETPSAELQISLLLEGMFPEVMDGFVIFSVYLDTDNDATTGEPFYDAVGVDKIIDVEVGLDSIIGMQPWDFRPGMPVPAYLFDVATFERTPLPSGVVERIVKILDGPDESGLPKVTDHVDGVSLRVPMELLDLTSEVVPGWVVSEDWPSFSPGDIDQVAFEWYLIVPDPPILTLSANHLKAGDQLGFTGRNFTPGSEVEISLDNKLIGTALVGPEGTFEGSLPWSEWHPSPVLDSRGFYHVTARDPSGSFGWSVVKVHPNPADLNTDGIVDSKDFSSFADNWLSTGAAIVADE